jgi:hypothetical protein
MPDPNAILSTVRRLDPPLDQAPEVLVRREGGLTVELADGRRLRLDPENPRSAGFATVLDGLRQQGLPVYLEVDPESSYIEQVRIPHVTRVVDIRPGEDGLDVHIEMSHARHLLRRGAPDFDALERRLRESMRGGGVVVLVEDDAHQILDVREFTPGPDSPLPPLPPFPRPELPRWPWPLRWLRELLRRIWFWRCWPWWWFRRRCMSPAAAQQLFDTLAATSCNPLTVPPPCIPFMYPDDGCWGRAHEMCRLMTLQGVTPRKVWIERADPGLLHVDTSNHPNCFVQWWWHVAPTVCVRRWRWFWCWGREMVMDPSMFTTPVTKAVWKAAQNNPGATLTDSHWTIFYLWGSLTDPTFAQTNQVLATYRLQLQLRSQGPAGPPPYANCP